MATITEERLKQLEQAERKLSALEAGGVDNWGGYDFALEELRKEEERDDKLEDIASKIEEILGEGLHEPAGRGAGYGFTDSSSVQLVKYLKTLKVDLDSIKS